MLAFLAGLVRLLLGVFMQFGDIRLPTLVMGLSAIAIMWGLRKYRPN